MYNSKSPKKRKITYNSWIKKVISGVDLGQRITLEDGSKKIVHLNTKDDILHFYRRLAAGGRDFLNRWTATKLANHRDSLTVHYFAGAAESSAVQTLVNIDVDCKKRGTPQGAQAFLQYLTTDECLKKYNFQLPRLYCEVSTNGNGGHGYFLLEKQDLGAEIINRTLLGRLTKLLNHILSCEGFDAEFVEIKGTLPDFTWGDQKFVLKSLKLGQLAKLPRDGESRFDELQATAVVKMWDLMKLPQDYDSVLSADADMQRPVAVDIASNGSISGKAISQDTLSALAVGGAYHGAAAALLDAHPIGKAGRHVVAIDDVAIFLMLGEFFSQNMNPDGTMPTKRFRALWEALHECGDVNRPWQPTRFSAIRNWLSSLNLINWESARFSPGKACKWEFSGDLLLMIANIRKKREILCTTHNAEAGSGDSQQREEERDPLYHTLEINVFPPEETITPYEIRTMPRYQHNPDEITALLAVA